jgi:hypothetical protein
MNIEVPISNLKNCIKELKLAAIQTDLKIGPNKFEIMHLQ